MPNFFDRDTIGDMGPDDDIRLIARALIGIALECSALGSEISETGGAISSRDAAASKTTRAVELQALDRLAQTAGAQATLIAYLARHLLTGAPCSGAEVLEMIQHVPLRDVRRRLRLAIGIPVLAEDVAEGDEADPWPDDPPAETEIN
jgi:hypothetical protein